MTLAMDKAEYCYCWVLSCESQDLESAFMSIHVELAGVTDRHSTRARSRVV